MAKASQGSKGNEVGDSAGRLPVSELLGEYQGANSPFGDDLQFPLGGSDMNYQHPETAVPHGETTV